MHVTAEDMQLNFELEPQQLQLNDVVVKSGAEDPAYEIIRNAIKKRPEYRSPLDSFTCEAYIKTLMKTRKPLNVFSGKDRFIGEKGYGELIRQGKASFIYQSPSQISLLRSRIK